MPRSPVPPRARLGHHQIAAPPPWQVERELPFDPEPAPGANPCRTCARRDSALEVELIAAYQSLHALEELLVWIGEEHESSNQWREQGEREIEELKALLGEVPFVQDIKTGLNPLPGFSDGWIELKVQKEKFRLIVDAKTERRTARRRVLAQPQNQAAAQHCKPRAV